MIRETVNALLACVVTLILCAVAYPAAAYGVGQLLFPREAAGSLIVRDGKVVGSALIGQSFGSGRYFHPRPSAAGANGYDASAASGSNLGTKNPALRERIAKSLAEWKATPEHPAPADLITASGSGLDPDISPEAAHYQEAGVAAARKLPVARVRALIDSHVSTSGAIIGAPPRVNVLALNLALDEEKPPADPPPSPTSQASPAPAPPAPTAEVAALKGEARALADRLGQLRGRIEAAGQDPAARKEQDARVADLTGRVARLVERAALLDGRVDAAERALHGLKSELDAARESLRLAEARHAAADRTSPPARPGRPR